MSKSEVVNGYTVNRWIRVCLRHVLDLVENANPVQHKLDILGKSTSTFFYFKWHSYLNNLFGKCGLEMILFLKSGFINKVNLGNCVQLLSTSYTFQERYYE